LCKTPKPGPIKNGIRKQSFQLVQGVLHVSKSTSIPLLPYKPHQTSQHHIPNIRAMFTKPISLAK